MTWQKIFAGMVLFVAIVWLFWFDSNERRSLAEEAKNDQVYLAQVESISAAPAALAEVTVFKRPNKRGTHVYIIEASSEKDGDIIAPLENGRYLSGMKDEHGNWHSVQICRHNLFSSHDCVSMATTDKDAMSQDIYAVFVHRLDNAIQEVVKPINRVK